MLECGKLIAAIAVRASEPGGRIIGRAIVSIFSSGHHGLVGHRGAARVIVACSLTSFARSLWIRASGGKHQAFSPVSGNNRPSLATECGSGHHEQYMRGCRLSRLAKRSMLCGPQRRTAFLNMSGRSSRSVLSCFQRESLSARWLSLPGRCTATGWMPNWWQVDLMLLAIAESTAYNRRDD